MDEKRFVNIYTDTEPLLREITLKIEPQTWICSLVFIAIGLCGVAYGYLYYQGTSLAVGAGLGVYGLYRFLQHIIGPKTLMAKIRKENGGQIPTATLEMGEKLTHTYQGTTTTVLFADVQKVYFLDHSIRLQAQQWYFTADRKGFIKGDAKDFEGYLREKCKNARFYHKESKKFREENA